MVLPPKNASGRPVTKLCLALETFRRTSDGRTRDAKAFLDHFFPHKPSGFDDRLFIHIPKEVRADLLSNWGIRGKKSALRDDDAKVRTTISDALGAGDIDASVIEQGVTPEILIDWIPLADWWSFWRGSVLPVVSTRKALSFARALSLFDERWFLEHLSVPGQNLSGIEVVCAALAKDQIGAWIRAVHMSGDASPAGLVASLGWDTILANTPPDALLVALDACARQSGLTGEETRMEPQPVSPPEPQPVSLTEPKPVPTAMHRAPVEPRKPASFTSTPRMPVAKPAPLVDSPKAPPVVATKPSSDAAKPAPAPMAAPASPTGPPPVAAAPALMTGPPPVAAPTPATTPPRARHSQPADMLPSVIIEPDPPLVPLVPPPPSRPPPLPPAASRPPPLPPGASRPPPVPSAPPRRSAPAAPLPIAPEPDFDPDLDPTPEPISVRPDARALFGTPEPPPPPAHGAVPPMRAPAVTLSGVGTPSFVEPTPPQVAVPSFPVREEPSWVPPRAEPGDMGWDLVHGVQRPMTTNVAPKYNFDEDDEPTGEVALMTDNNRA